MYNKLQNIENNIADWLKFAEAKNAALITFNSAFCFFLFKYFENLNKGYEKTLIAIFIICLIISIFVCLLSFIAKINGPRFNKIVLKFIEKQKETDNLLYYKDIAKYSVEDYKFLFYSKFSTLSNDEIPSKIDAFENELIKQICALSKIALKKYIFFNTSLYITLLPVIFFVVAIIIA